ncbi:hypothetical protein BH23ACT4_BH23ACT4_08330 [soil metagenome]
MSTQAKSVTVIPAAWDRMNSIHVGPVQSCEGSIPAVRRILHTVDAGILWPSLASSPWMRRYPQFGLSPARRMVSFSEFGVDGWSSWFRGWWLGPVAGDETSMPPDDGLGPHDMEHVGEASTVQHAGCQREGRTIRVGELSSVDLALQHQDLMPEGEDLGVAFVTGREEPSEPGKGKSWEGSEQDHDGCTVPTPMWVETPRSAAPTSIRPPQGTAPGRPIVEHNAAYATPSAESGARMGPG